MKLNQISFKKEALQKQGTTLKTEIVAGITTFLAMAYILAVNPNILSASGMDAGAVFTATALSSAIATLVMGVVANLPFALAPGMGLNAFLAFTVCLGMGFSWQFALTAVFCEGIIFILLTAFNVREAIVNSIPSSLKKAISVGIGLFIAFIGLQNAGIIVGDPSTLVALDLTSKSAILAFIGLAITAILIAFNVKGGLLIGIIATAIIGIPFGLTSFSGIKGADFLPPSLAPTFGACFDFKEVIHNLPTFLVVMFTFLFVDMFDTVGTLIGCAEKADMVKDDTIPNCKQALFADAIGTTVGAILGTSTVTTFVESSTGVVEGGRTGVTSVVTSALFIISLFLSPIFLRIPSAATAPALILVGFYMITPVKDIDFKDPTEGIPAFLCILMMICAYSISDGIMFGILAYVVINLCKANFKKLSIATYIVAALFVVKIILNVIV